MLKDLVETHVRSREKIVFLFKDIVGIKGLNLSLYEKIINAYYVYYHFPNGLPIAELLNQIHKTFKAQKIDDCEANRLRVMASRSYDFWIKHKLMKKIKSKDDSRSLLVTFTDKGLKKFSEVEKIFNEK